MKYFLTLCALVAALTSCSPSDPSKSLMEAHNMMLRLDYVKAQPKIRECLAIDNQNVDAIIMDAVCAYSMSAATDSDRKAARLNISRAQAIAPRRFDVWYTATWVNLKDGNYTDAVNAARKARDLYRSQHNPVIPQNAACDEHDKTLAKENPTYANLMVMMADICSHNSLEEGLPYFFVALSIRPMTKIPEIYISYANLYYRTRYTANAYKILKSAVNQFPRNLACAYNFAFIDEARRKGMRLNSTQVNTLAYNYRRVLKLADEQGDEAIKRRVVSHLLKLQ